MSADQETSVRVFETLAKRAELLAGPSAGAGRFLPRSFVCVEVDSLTKSPPEFWKVSNFPAPLFLHLMM